MFKTVTIEQDDNVAILTLNRPEALNAVNRQLAADVCAALTRLNDDPVTRAIVLTGAGERSFSSGADLKEARDMQVHEIEAWFGGVVNIYRTILMIDKLVIAAINGVAAGAGLQMALVSDLRVGHPGTRMGQPEINAGIPSIMGSYWMSLHLGWSLNQDLSFTGRLMDADECHRVGLLNRVVPTHELMSQTLALAHDLATKPSTAMRHTKQRFRELALAGFDDAFRAGVRGQQEAYANGEPQAIMERFAADRAKRKQ